MKVLLLIASHGAVLAAGFALGVYALPILIAPEAPPVTDIQALAGEALFEGRFRRDLEGSDLLHWGEGVVSLGPTAVSLLGTLAPGPDYKLYLAPEFVQTEAEFLRVKDISVRVGEVKTFDNFVVPLPDSVDPLRYNTVVIWCETFSQFISAAKYR